MRKFYGRLNKSVNPTFIVRFSGTKNKSPHNYDTIVEVTTPCRGNAYDEAYQHYWNMWKDNIEKLEVHSHPHFFISELD